MNQASSKILVLTAAIAIIAGGILTWQYFEVPKEKGKIPKEEVRVPEKKEEVKAPEDETANWKTYRNDKYGFEVQYPNGWVFENYGNGAKFGEKKIVDAEYTKGHFEKVPLFEIGFSLTVYPSISTFAGGGIWQATKGATTLENWAERVSQILDKEKGEGIEPIAFGVDNYKGFSVKIMKEIGVPHLMQKVVAQRNAKIYLIEDRILTVQSTGFTEYDYDKVFSQMLSTFRFTKIDKNADFSSLNKDELLHKLFPKLTFTDGIANHTAEYPEYLNLHLQDSIEDYFINTQEKNFLLIVKLDGVAHAGGLYHAYLGLFDKNRNLLTPVSCYPSCDFFEGEAYFGGDMGDFGFYDCKGVKYIAFASAGCPNGSCCFGKVELFRINKGNFEKIQTIDENSLAKSNVVYAAADSPYGLKMILSGEKIIVKKVPSTSENGCPETNYKELKWNKNSCRFK